MSTFTALHSMLKGLVAGKGPTEAEVAQSIVQAVYDRIKTAAPTNATQVQNAGWRLACCVLRWCS
jgi:hypothetical protein